MLNSFQCIKDIDHEKDQDKESEIIETGIAMFQIEEYWHKPMSYFFFYNYIPEKYNNFFEQSIPMLKLRNTLIVLGLLEIISALIGCSYYFISKNEMHIFISISAFVLSIAGVTFFSLVNEIGIIFYSLLTICIPGLFFIHQLFNYAFLTRTGNNNINEISLYGIFTLPYVFDMLCGFVSIVYLKMISETNDTIMRLSVVKDEEKLLLSNKKQIANDKYTKTYLKSEFNKRKALKANEIEDGQINLLCVICCDKPRQVLIEPCRHLLLCENCMNRISNLNNNNMICPNCARQIDYFAKIYI